MNAIAACFRSGVEYRITDPVRLAKKYLILAQDAQGKGVNQRVEAVRFVKDHFASDRGHTETVAIMADALNTAF